MACKKGFTGRTPVFRQRVELLRTMKGYNRMVAETERGEIWKLNAFGGG